MKSTYPAVFNLGNLNGQNGFIIDGEATGDLCGISVSVAGDINKDGFNDLIIGSAGHTFNTSVYRPGRTYIIFGNTNIASNGLLSLTSLNSTNGYRIDGEASGDYSGASVSSAGNVYINNCETLIGAYGHPNQQNIGRAYLVRGDYLASAPGGILPLSSLGASGFIFDGEAAGDFLGWVPNGVSSAGDFDHDGYVDILLGAPFHNGTYYQAVGRGYLVYGGSNIPSGGTLSLSSLNGANGFKIDGEVMGDCAAYQVTAAGDVNGDHFADLFLSSPYYNSSAKYTGMGRAYVIYGGPRSMSSILPLSSLNGTNGFKIDGEIYINGYENNFPISAAGDVNGDGHSDLLIGTSFYGNNTGRSYVVYGSNATVSGGALSLSSLNGGNGFKMDGEKVNDNSGIAVSTAGDFNGDGYSDLLISAENARQVGCIYVVFGGPSVGAGGIINLSNLNGTNGFILLLKSGGTAVEAMSGGKDINGDSLDDIVLGGYDNPGAYVIFGDVSPQLINNQLTIQRGATLVLTPQNLNATDNAPVTFSITNVQHGQFELVSVPAQAITTFTQSQVSNHQVQFVHGGSNFPPSYDVQMINTGIALSPPPQTVSFNATHNGPTKVQDIPAKLWVWTVEQQISIPLNGTFSDLDIGQTLIYSATSLPDGLSITQSPPELGGLVTQPLQSNILIKATDSLGLSANTSFTLQVEAAAPSPCSVPGMSHYQSGDVICKAVNGLIIGLPSTFGGIALAALGAWLRQRDIEKTWNEKRYAIHNQLRRELKLEIGRATNEKDYIAQVYKLIGAVLNIQTEDSKQRSSQHIRRDSQYNLTVGDTVGSLSEQDQSRYGAALVKAIREHITFPALYCDNQEVKEVKSVKLVMPIYRYLNGCIPNPFSCLTTYEFRSDVLVAAFDSIVRTARSSLGEEAVDDRPASGSRTGLGSGSALFTEPRAKDTVELGDLAGNENAYHI